MVSRNWVVNIVSSRVFNLKNIFVLGYVYGFVLHWVGIWVKVVNITFDWKIISTGCKFGMLKLNS